MKLIVQCPKCKRVLKPTRGLLKPKCPKCDRKLRRDVVIITYKRSDNSEG